MIENYGPLQVDIQPAKSNKFWRAAPMTLLANLCSGCPQFPINSREFVQTFGVKNAAYVFL
jgi:hypothetical protein